MNEKQNKEWSTKMAILETQMLQNEKDHQAIIKRIDHNCDEAQKRFDRLEEIIETALQSKANKWVEWYTKAMIIALSTGVIGFILFFIEGSITFK
jgi:hypothetical protein